MRDYAEAVRLFELGNTVAGALPQIRNTHGPLSSMEKREPLWEAP